ncbi:flagellar type III secretion system pore protein FliP [Endozoicomonas arenosclerae]|uniref:flagellar type III secretion system pore protein FliP n=1 Tax=Endozoicomonas arenosclerae TaxID=1633495 RepID=UPI00078321D7|nr:flagellar type III secretion system pore protein FliP [Endozoicomonas arenosclerae]
MSRYLLLALLLIPTLSLAEPSGFPLLTVTDTEDGQEYSATLQILVLMTLIGFIPAALMMLTSFTRIIIVLAILRQAIGLQQSPPNQVLIGIALALTLLIMSPIFGKMYNQAVTPYMNEELTMMQALKTASEPMRTFMLNQTRETDLSLFMRIGNEEGIPLEEVSFSILIPSFITSELKTAFQIGFIIYIPFLVIDLVVASVLMAMGMIMLSPQMISLPFKLMLFVLVDGWVLTMGTLASSFG